MAMEKVQSGGGKYLAFDALKTGESILGYLIETSESRKYEGKHDLVMKAHKAGSYAQKDGKVIELQAGDVFVLSTSGDLKWAAKDLADGKPARGLDKAKGFLCELTKTGTRPNKAGQKVSTFEVGYDKDFPLAVAPATTFQPDGTEEIPF